MEGSSSFDSSTVATLFAEKYYAQLSEDPKWLYRFFTSTGIMAHLGYYNLLFLLAIMHLLNHPLRYTLCQL